jgi:hypothetical protein
MIHIIVGSIAGGCILAGFIIGLTLIFQSSKKIKK